MSGGDGMMSAVRNRMREDWPAVLAILVLIGSHLYLTTLAQQEVRPFGIPLVAALVVFLVAEILRRVVDRT